MAEEIKTNWKCWFFSHKWIPVYICGEHGKFIGCYCKRCKSGEEELREFIESNRTVICSYDEKYF